ncbi:MAG: HEPN domain-containing protein [Campylobacterota bacterium]|nr:HEPN domain-containing protein [Campylobacterota bacterium]
MRLNLHPECKKGIIKILSEQLPNVRVRNKVFIEIESAYGLSNTAEKSLPQNIKNQLEQQYIGEIPLFNFIYETLSRKLYETQKYNPEIPSIKLTEIKGYQDPTAVATRLVKSFDSLPWEYFLTIKFKNDFGELFCGTIKQYSFCDSIRLTTAGQDLKDNFPLKSGIEARDRSLSSGRLDLTRSLPPPKPQEWEENATYFQVRVSGFIGGYGGTVPVEEAVSTLKSFCGLSIALRLLKVNYRYKTTPSKSKFFIHRNIKDKWVIEGIHKLEASTSETFNDLVLHDVNGPLDTEEKKVQRIRRRLDLIKYVFSNKEKAKKILSAGRWLFDSYCGKNELLSFVQTTVVLEILLGEKSMSDVMGLGELLRNRCAYLIGKSHKEREKILSDFKKIYDIRSKIVHRGKDRLNFEERFLFSNLQWMCRRVIQEEVNLLFKDIENLHNNEVNTNGK